ncbi:MAG: hypothetical protein KGJ95_10525 [Candidatus Omnitrophica bacterium]|nr:hypothetical protein [Candidatus Omnitrophota bacterium]MDE2232475.1 hypothetical protein [Candidatus Omnitrophota bacterium]
MPVIQGSVSVSASSVVDNVITGSQFEFLPYNAHLDFGLVGSATGLVCDVYTGQHTITEALAPSTQNRVPVYPDDFTLQDVAGAGERVKIRVRNTTAGTLTLFYTMKITPV